MKVNSFSILHFVLVVGVFLFLGKGEPAWAYGESQCALEQESICPWENDFTSEEYNGKLQFSGVPSGHERFAHRHGGGCREEEGADVEGCMQGRGHRHGGRHGMHGGHGMHRGGSQGETSTAQCPQERNTVQAPEPMQSLKNPLSSTPGQVEQGRLLFQLEVQPSCTACHGVAGDGGGPMGMGLVPPARNFTCAETMNQISDGQLFWIIRNGSEGTAMPAFGHLSDESVWQIILYLRQLGNK